MDKEKYTEAYNRLLQNLKNTWRETEEQALPPLKEGMEKAKQKLSDWGELSKEEVEHVAGYLKRDLDEAAGFLSASGKSMKEWLKRDLEFAEYKFAELFADLADNARVELDRLAERARKVGEWHTGETTGVGILECKACGEKLHFKKPGHIPPCPKCKGTVYRKLFSED